MKKKIGLLLAFSLIMTPATVQSAEEPLRLKATSSWQIDYADDRCRLARRFGADETTVNIFLDRYGPDESFRLTVAGKPVKTGILKAEAAITFGPSESLQKVNFNNGTSGEMPALHFANRIRIGLPSEEELAAEAKHNGSYLEFEYTPISDARQKAVRYLQIGKPLHQSVILETGSMKAPLDALNACIDDLMGHWGIDVEKHRNLKRPASPTKSPSKWIMSSDYPSNMLVSGQPAIIEFRLSIGTDGVPTHCHIQATTRPKAFDDAVCKSVMRRARFDPALDSEGKPIPSFYRNTVHFQIP